MNPRILHVVDSFLPEAGSLGLSVRLTAGLLVDHGVPTIVLVGRPTELPPDAAAGPIELRSFNRAHAAEEVQLCDAVHIHGWGYDAARLLAREARRAGKPYIISPCGALICGSFRPPVWSDRLRGLLGGDGLVRHAAALIAQNQLEAEELASRTSTDRVHVVPYGLDFVTFEAIPPDDVANAPMPADRILLVLAPIEPMYGGISLLKAMAELGADADGWCMVFAGSEVGDWRKQCAAAVQRKGGAGRVRFVDAPDRASQRALLARAAALAAVGLHVHTPISIMQALACGVPVLTTNLVTPPDLGDGMITCPPERAAIRLALRDLLRLNDDERTKLGQRGREYAKAQCDGPVLVEKLLDVYGRVTKRAASPVAASMA